MWKPSKHYWYLTKDRIRKLRDRYECKIVLFNKTTIKQNMWRKESNWKKLKWKKFKQGYI
jgi:hypothetical protein